MTTILDALQKGTGYLEKHGVESARLNMQYLVAHVVGCSRMQLYVDFDRPLEDRELEALRSLTRERGNGRPLQHLLGTVEFLDHEFKCDERALIPRPETELLTDRLLKMPWKDGVRILDLGCGSGVIGLSLAAGLSKLKPQVTLADISQDALALAKENAELLGDALSAASVEFVESDLFSAIDGRFDLIVANLPYISESDMEELSVEVKHDPERALVGGTAGTEIMERFLQEVGDHIQSGGLIAMEFGFGQENRLVEVARELSLGETEVLKDDSGVDRNLLVRCP